MYSHTRSVLLLILLLHLFDAGLGESDLCLVTKIEDEVSRILSLYNEDQLPEKDGDVILELDIHHVMVLEKTFSVQLFGRIQMTWIDKRLKWSTSTYNCTKTLIDSDSLWRPDIVILNGGAEERPADYTLKAQVTTNGTVTWSRVIDVTVPCYIDLVKWPNDVQSCAFKFGSRRHTVEQISLAIINNKNGTDLESGSWKLLSSSGRLQNVSRAGEIYNIGEWTMSFRRLSPAHSTATNSIFVSIILEFVATALLPPLERISLCACIALTVTLWLFATLLRLPGSGNAPLILPLMSAILIITCLTALFAALVQRIAKHQSLPPTSLRRLLTKIATVMKIMPELSTDYGNGACVWIAAATLLDQILLVIELLSLLIILLIHIFYTI